mmetsp:Transcript_72238/g.221193  ORF Transcript_72238/g.221193 Transcript_72238/m.221193 type:complete len:240 (+) Transcript_72238:856-1575(+)
MPPFGDHLRLAPRHRGPHGEAAERSPPGWREVVPFEHVTRPAAADPGRLHVRTRARGRSDHGVRHGLGQAGHPDCLASGYAQEHRELHPGDRAMFARWRPRTLHRAGVFRRLQVDAVDGERQGRLGCAGRRRAPVAAHAASRRGLGEEGPGATARFLGRGHGKGGALCGSAQGRGRPAVVAAFPCGLRGARHGGGARNAAGRDPFGLGALRAARAGGREAALALPNEVEAAVFRAEHCR